MHNFVTAHPHLILRHLEMASHTVRHSPQWHSAYSGILSAATIAVSPVVKKKSSPGLIGTLVRTAGQVYPFAGVRRLKDKSKYVARGLLTPRLTRAWFEILDQPELEPFRRWHPRLFSKLQRPYLHRQLKPAAALAALRAHYEFIVKTFSGAAIEQVCQREGVKLATLTVPEVGDFSVRLAYRSKFEKEGEFTLGLIDERSQQIWFTLSFTIWKESPPRELFIGGLQGVQQNNLREDVVAITRGMHGLRPKALLLFTAQQIAAAFDLAAIRATSDDLNVFRDLRLRHKKVVASYDEFWTDSDGKLAADGLFTLPARFEPRPVSELKPNKRSLYKKRYAMLEILGAQMQTSLRGLGKTAARPAR